MQWIVITQPVDKCPKKFWKVFIIEYDIHDGIIANERGSGGYRHWQQRLRVSDSNLDKQFRTLQRVGAHVERAQSDMLDYERKGGRYIILGEHGEVRRVRFGNLRKWQKGVLQQLETQSDRQILTIVDTVGGSGKSFLAIHLYEQRKACYISPSSKNVARDVASAWKREPIIVIDIPRTMKWSDELYLGLERVKDGLITDDRFKHRTVNVRGCKVLVMTNHAPKVDKLSEDRWVIMTPKDQEILYEIRRDLARGSNRNTKNPLPLGKGGKLPP